MMKKHDFREKKASYKQRTSTKTILLMLVLTGFALLFIGNVSAEEIFQFDNIKQYDPETETITIVNTFGLGRDIAELKLNTPHNVKVGAGYGKVAEFKIELFEDYTDAFGNMKFYDLKSDWEEINRDFDYKYLVTENVDVDDYEIQITGYINGTAIYEKVLVGTYKELQSNWYDLTETTFYEGELTIGIFTDVQVGDYVEWIPTIFGVKIDEWATWTASLNVGLVSWYKLDESSGTVIDSLGTHNGTNSGAIPNVEGIINTAYEFNRGDDEIDITDSADFNNPTGYSVSMWYNGTGIGTNFFGQWGDAGAGNAAWYVGLTSEKPSITHYDGSGSGSFVTTNTINDSNWHNLIFVYTGGDSGTNAFIYIDGVLNGSGTINKVPQDSGYDITIGHSAAGAALAVNGTYDEIGYWNRTLNASEVTILYNEGLGCTLNLCISLGPQITLNSPADNFKTTNQTIIFNGSAVTFQTDPIVNVSLILNGVYNETNTSGINNTNYIFTRTLGFNTYNWTYEVCDNETICTNATVRSFEIANFIENNITFNATSLETETQEFELNITTIPAILSISAFLNYNGTRVSSDTSCVGLDCTITNTIDIPLVLTGENDNKTFFWEITAFDGTSSVSTNTTSSQQNVSRIHLERCNATYPVPTLNFTAYDEQNLTQINPFKFDGTFLQWVGEGTVKRSKSFSDASTENVTLCILPDDEIYFIDAQIDYDEVGNGTTYTVRNYFFQNATISNSTQEIFLYLLEASSSTSFILKVQDDSLLPVVEALIETHRFYPGTGEFRIVQIARTDEAGKSVGFFETETVDYKFVIKQNETILLETETQKVIPETSPFTLTFNIGEPLGEPWQSQEELDDLQSSLTITNSSGTVTYIYIDSSGNFELGRLLVIKEDLTNSSNDTTICDVNSSLTSATLVCNVGTANGFYVGSAFITRSSVEELDLQVTFQIETLSQTVGLLGLFFGWFLILIAAFMFKFNEIAGIWAITITVFLVNLTGLIKFGGVFVTATIGIAIILTWILEK